MHRSNDGDNRLFVSSSVCLCISGLCGTVGVSRYVCFTAPRWLPRMLDIGLHATLTVHSIHVITPFKL